MEEVDSISYRNTTIFLYKYKNNNIEIWIEADSSDTT